jgi:hypothetical protein
MLQMPRNKGFFDEITAILGTWRNRLKLHGVQGVPSSNLGVPTNLIKHLRNPRFFSVSTLVSTFTEIHMRKSVPSSELPSDFELVGYTGRRVIVAAGEDRGIGVGRLVDADALRRSPMFERLAPADRQLVVALVNGCRP